MNEDLAQNSVGRRFRPALVDFGTAKGWSLMGGCRSAQLDGDATDLFTPLVSFP
jgi:hypothetical protein